MRIEGKDNRRRDLPYTPIGEYGIGMGICLPEDPRRGFSMHNTAAHRPVGKRPSASTRLIAPQGLDIMDPFPYPQAGQNRSLINDPRPFRHQPVRKEDRHDMRRMHYFIFFGLLVLHLVSACGDGGRQVRRPFPLGSFPASAGGYRHAVAIDETVFDGWEGLCGS